MFPESAHISIQLHHAVLIAALTVFVKDLGGRGWGVQAWTYHYGSRMKWEDAHIWCKNHYTGLVVINNEEETAFINDRLPFNRKYYWIGVKKVEEDWNWVDANRTVPLEAQNWAIGEPDEIPGQDCVEIYIKRDDDTAKWNNEMCHHRKAALCFRDSCTPDSCSVHADCVETVGNYTCQCHPGFMGSRCQEAQPCPVLNGTLRGGRVNCSHPFAPHSYNSTCEVSCNEGYELHRYDLIRCDHTGQWTASLPTCEVKQCPPIFFPITGNMTCVDAVKPFSFGSQCDFTCQEGHLLTGNHTLTCLASGNWSEPPPTCTVVQCNTLKGPSHGSMHCQGPLGEHSYGSMCALQCDDGFEPIDSNFTKCSASGNWSHPLPVCRAKKCHPINAPPHGNMSCSVQNGPFSFGSKCVSVCDKGFFLNGTEKIECTSMGAWNADVPQCLVKTCPSLNSPPHGSLVCTDTHGSFSFDSTCVSTCDEGFVLNGTANTECTSSGNWSTDVPQCLAQKCPTLNSPPHGSINCTDPYGAFSFGSKCVSVCDEGFFLNGTDNIECTSMGAWNADVPQCLVKTCPSLNSPPHGSLVCTDTHGSFSFDSTCVSTCDEGFVLNGTANTECTSSGNWSTDVPQCLAQKCPTLNSPPHGSINCTDPHGAFSFGSKCVSVCDKGFFLNGTDNIECTSMGAWNADVPQCLVKTCPSLNSPPHGSLVCTDTHGSFSFDSTCVSTCDEGFVLNGTANTECTSSGNWSTDVPQCLAQKCPTLNSPPHGSINCTDPYGAFSFGSKCVSVCDKGFFLNGTDNIECTSMGAWNADVPQCLVKTCPSLNSPPHGSLVCTDTHGSFSFDSTCVSTCDEGFVLNGTANTECTSSGNWSTDVPQCLAQKCPTLNSPPHGSINCTDPHGAFSFGSKCVSVCDKGFVLNGTDNIECTSSGNWSTDVPQCSAQKCPTLNSPPHGSINCTDPHGAFSFGSKCVSNCERGFLLNASADTQCTAQATWSREIPHCQARSCPLLDKPPQYGQINCSHPYSLFSYGSHCNFECDEGFRLKGASSVLCNSTGYWSENLPTCHPVKCKAIPALSLTLSMNCSHPLGNFSFGSQCLFSCEEGYSLNGTDVSLCLSTGVWDNSLPTCKAEGPPVGTAMLLYTGVGAASAVLSLASIGLAMLVLTRCRKRGNSFLSDEHAWDDNVNPAFES